ncbi:MAG: J domain-containing protein [Steroidobacteraceae bacterium]
MSQTPHATRSLFGDDEGAGTSLVQVLTASRPASKAQKQFQRLIGRIERCREQIQAWQAYSIRYNNRILKEVEPLRVEFSGAQRDMILRIDELLSGSPPAFRLRKAHRTRLRELLLTLADDLLGRDADEEIQGLRRKYGGNSPQQGLEDTESDALREILEQAFGFDLEAEADADPEQLLRQAQREIDEDEADFLAPEGRRSRTKRGGRRSNGTQAGETMADPARGGRADAAREASQSLRDVFRKLASALHPDREPDAAARERKTALMQRVNQAYQAGDLLSLLSLQLEIEQVDAAHLSALPAGRLAHYNPLLREQLKELEAELQRHTEPYQAIMAAAGRHAFTPVDVDRQLSADIAEQRSALRELREDLLAFADPSRLRERLARFEPEPAAFETPEELAALAEFLEIAQLAESFGTPGRPRRRRSSRRR